MNSRIRYLPILISVVLFMGGTTLVWPAIPKPAGKVTQVAGKATLHRIGLKEILPVHFSDAVFLQDKITTQEQSFVRVLLGGKALVTVRESSVLTITEEENHATIDMLSGIMSLSVARKRMNPGEYIEIRTPHGVAAVRGTIAVTEVFDTTTFSLITGDMGVGPLGSKLENLIALPAGNQVQANDQGMGTPQEMPPDVQQQKAKLADAPDQPDESPVEEQVAQDQGEQATALAETLAPDTNNTDGETEEGDSTQGQGNDTEGEGDGGLLTETDSEVSSSDPITQTDTPVLSITVEDPIALVPASPLVNGSFETGDLTGWTLVNEAGGIGSGFIYTAGGSAPLSGFALPDPIDGNFALTTDQTNPGTHVLFQEFTVPDTNGMLRYSDFIQNSAGDFFIPNPDTLSFAIAGFNQQARVDILRPGTDPFSIDPGDILLTLDRTQPGDPLNTNFQTRTFDLSQFAGQLVRFRFAEVDNIGFFQAGVDNVSLFAEVVTSTALVQLFGDDLLVTSSIKPHLRLIGETHFIATDPGEAIFDLHGSTSSTEVDPETGLTVGTDRPIQGRENGAVAPIQNPLLELTSEAEVNTGQFLKIDTALLEATAPLLNLINSTVNATPSDANAGFIDLSYQAKVLSDGPILAMDNSIMNVNSGSFASLANQTVFSLSGDFISLINGSALNITSANGFLVSASGNSAFNVTGALINFGGTGNNVVLAQNSAFSETINGVAFSFINGATNGQVSVTGTPIQNVGLGAVNLPNGGSLIQVDGPDAIVTIQGQ